MIIRNDSDFYIEHGGDRRGYFDSRTRPPDVGGRDDYLSMVYRAEERAEKRFGKNSTVINCPIRHYIVASIVDAIVSTDQYVDWFGGTHLLIVFNPKRSRSRAWVGCLEFSDHKTHGLAWYDIYHELAHHVTLRDDEPAHGERFRSAMLLITSLSPYSSHVSELARQFRKEGIMPRNKYFESQFSH